MRLHRFLRDLNLEADKLILTEEDLIHQLRSVLRLQVGDQFVIVNTTGQEARLQINQMEKGKILCAVQERKINENEPARQVTLYCSLLKKENFEMVCQKAVEAGVTQIVPIICQRTVKLGYKPERLQTIILEAAEQSGRALLPELKPVIKFAEAVAQAKSQGKVLFFDGSGQPMKSLGATDSVAIFIGPEGGWDDQEIKQAQAAGFDMVSLGKLILRAETAAIIGTYLAAH